MCFPFIVFESLILILKYRNPTTGNYEKEILNFLETYKIKIILISSFLGSLPVLAGALIQYFRMQRDSGKYIAKLLFATEVIPNAKSFYKKRLMNIVAEISIASGVPSPRVFILTKEAGINALTAGTNSHDAVLCVTRGACELLKRDELQSLIAHEFSHLINGDMKFNTFSMQLLHGFYLSLQTVDKIDVSNGSSGSVLRDMLILPFQIFMLLLLIPLWLWLYGKFFGTLGNIIKSAFCRKREYLADAYAVQYTRYPEALANTLNIIQNASAWQTISHTAGFEMSSFFFSSPTYYNAVPRFISFLSATHPEPVQRIRKIMPNFKFILKKIDRKSLKKRIFKLRNGISKYDEDNLAEPIAHMTFLQNLSEPLNNEPSFTSSVSFKSSSEILEKIPSPLKEMLKVPELATPLIYAVLTDNESEDVRKHQFEMILERTSPETASIHSSAFFEMKNLPLSTLMVLTELAIPALRKLNQLQYDEFKTMCMNLIMTDNQISFFEYTVFCMLTIILDSTITSNERNNSQGNEHQEIEYILSFASYCGADSKDLAEKAFQKAVRKSNEKGYFTLQKITPINFEKLNDIIKSIAKMKTKRKRDIVNACFVAICKDKKITETEWCILRLLSIALQTPFPLP